MKLMTEREQVLDVADRWDEQFELFRHEGFMQEYGINEIVNKLRLLDKDTASAADVAKIIGNHSWVSESACDECGKLTLDAVRFSSACDDYVPLFLCEECLRKAVKLIEEGRNS